MDAIMINANNVVTATNSESRAAAHKSTNTWDSDAPVHVRMAMTQHDVKLQKMHDETMIQ
jgi:hypothetical protein